MAKYGKRERYDAAQQQVQSGLWRIDAEAGHIYSVVKTKPIGSERGGYWRVAVPVTLGKFNYVSAHRVIWEYIHGPSDLDLTLNHINGNHSDNRIANLELISNKDNSVHGHSVLGRGNGSRNRGSANPRAKLTEETALVIKSKLQNGVRGAVLAREFGVSPMTISNIKHGIIWKDVA